MEFENCKTLNDYIKNGFDINCIPEKLQNLPHDQTLKKGEQSLLSDCDLLYCFSEGEIEGVENPGGFPQNVVSKLPRFLLIPAQDRQEEISSSSGTLQKTLEELFKEIRDASENYREAQRFLEKLQEELLDVALSQDDDHHYRKNLSQIERCRNTHLKRILEIFIAALIYPSHDRQRIVY